MALDKFFKISERNSKLSTEIRAGIVTFITMAYILPVNSSILSDSGLDYGAVFLATAIATAIGTLFLGLYAKVPFAQAPGMGLNAFFTYTVCFGMGVSPSFALAAVLVEGVIFIVLSITNIRTKLLEALPKNLRIAIAAGIGMFIMFIGLKNAGIVIADGATFVAIQGNLLQPTVFVTILGIIITAILWLKKVKGSLLIGIIVTWILGIIAQLTGWYKVDAAAGVYSMLPSGIIGNFPSLKPTFGLAFDGLKDAFSSVENIGKFVIVMLTFLYVDIFDTLGTFAGLSVKAKLADGKGNFPGAGKAFTSDAIGTTIGAILGTSTVTTYIESAAGIEEGGRTGLTAVVVAILFAVAIPFYPIISAIPGFATAPALVLVGVMMCEVLKDFDWSDSVALISGIITIIFMVLGYSISAGIMWGVIFYLVGRTFTGKFKEPGIVLWVLGILFVVKIFLLR